MESEPISDRPAARRIRTSCVCGFRLVGVRVADQAGRVWVQYRAVDARGRVKAGDRITTCPSCRQPLPALSWREFLAKMPDAYGA